MLTILKTLLTTAASVLKGRRDLALENLALRQQLACLKAKTGRPRLSNSDRIFWVALSRVWPGWRSSLHLVQPETVLRWHRKGFRLFWAWKSRSRIPGRPTVPKETRDLNRSHLVRILREYLGSYYHPARTHLSLGRDSPFPREVEPPDMGGATRSRQSAPSLHPSSSLSWTHDNLTVLVGPVRPYCFETTTNQSERPLNAVSKIGKGPVKLTRDIYEKK